MFLTVCNCTVFFLHMFWLFINPGQYIFSHITIVWHSWKQSKIHKLSAACVDYFSVKIGLIHLETFYMQRCSLIEVLENNSISLINYNTFHKILKLWWIWYNKPHYKSLQYRDRFFLKLRKIHLKKRTVKQRMDFFPLPGSCFLTEYIASVSLRFQLTVFFRLILYLQETV